MTASRRDKSRVKYKHHKLCDPESLNRPQSISPRQATRSFNCPKYQTKGDATSSGESMTTIWSSGFACRVMPTTRSRSWASAGVLDGLFQSRTIPAAPMIPKTREIPTKDRRRAFSDFAKQSMSVAMPLPANKQIAGARCWAARALPPYG